ncbi:hypothetical protein DVH24_031494 [Malus domestica]|uniref:Uncharacterized protein n=1 Tax=Malus domestica TaxID=3750 RepID=A0A498HJ47_MALDO|nr:hypothetical protein DVH24_031494 [Malus domestica]
MEITCCWSLLLQRLLNLPCRVRLKKLASPSTCWQTHDVYRHKFDGSVGKLVIILLLFMVFLWAKDIRVSCPLRIRLWEHDELKDFPIFPSGV